jgi:hypothetical protein
MWTAISLAGGLAGTLTGLIAVIWLVKKLSSGHDRERGAIMMNADLSKQVDGLTRAMENRDHALSAVQDELRGEQQARVLAEKHRTEALKALANMAPTHVLVGAITDELELLSNLSKTPPPAPAASDPAKSALHGPVPKPPNP